MTNSPDDNRHPIIVRAGTLSAFMAEVPLGASVRVMQTHRLQETSAPSSSMPRHSPPAGK